MGTLSSGVQQDDNLQPLASAYEPNSGRVVVPQAAFATQDPATGRWYGAPRPPSLGPALPAWSSQPTQTAAAGADTVLKFGTDGKTTAHSIKMQNNTGASIFYAYDQSSTVSGNAIYTLATGQTLFEDRSFATLHLSSAAQQSIGGQSGITVEAFA